MSTASPPSGGPSGGSAQRTSDPSPGASGASLVPPEPGGVLAIAGELAAGRRRTRVSRMLRWAAVPVLLVLWIAFWAAPLVPGFPFLIVALFLMAPDFPPAHRFAAWVQRRFPKLRRTVPRRWRRVERVRR